MPIESDGSHEAFETKDAHSGSSSLRLSYRPPYRWEQILDFLGGRAIAGAEMVKNGEYLRTARLETADGSSVSGWLRVIHRPEQNALAVTVSEALTPVLPKVSARVRHLFDLCCDPYEIYGALQAMNEIRPGACVLGTRLPGCFDAFEMAVRAILGQQITVKAAGTLAARVIDRYGTSIQTGIEGLTRIFPAPESVLAMGDDIEDNLGTLGVTGARSKTIRELARLMAEGEVELGLRARPEEEMKRLMGIRGIGNWTAQYIAMRAMGWTDSFLETDAGIRKALPGYSPKELLGIAEAWRPWRSYATVGLWDTL
ncbi:MAG: hypothetical protein FWG96_04010 [Methanomassiliicoccaceae archaeon]|nr:hypothetical protein [Methanomassiliicoccaceae archaeon]